MYFLKIRLNNPLNLPIQQVRTEESPRLNLLPNTTCNYHLLIDPLIRALALRR